MKSSVLSQALQSLNLYNNFNPFLLIVFASLCDFFSRKGLLQDRCSSSFVEDIAFCQKNFENFRKIREQLPLIDKFSNEVNEKLYQELKHLSLDNADVSAEDLSILDLLENKNFTGKDYYLNAEKVLSSMIAKWLVNRKTGLKIYCPFNNLINVEITLARENNIVAADFDEDLIAARIMYALCNGLKAPSYFDDNHKCLTDFDLVETYDCAFSFPPLGWRILHKGIAEFLLLNELHTNVSGRFCMILTMGFTFQGGKVATLRKLIVDNRRLSAVVELPSGFMQNSHVSCVALFFEEANKQQDFITITSLAHKDCIDQAKSSKYKTILAVSAAEYLENCLQGKESPYSQMVSIDTIIKNDYMLTPAHYLLSDEAEDAKEAVLKGDTRLSEIAEFVRVQPNRSENSGKLYYEVSAASISPVGFIENPEKKIFLPSDKDVTNCLLKMNDIIFAIKGSVGKVGMVVSDQDNWLVNQSFVIIRVTNQDWPAEFVFRQLKSTAMKLYVQSKSTGSVIPSLTMNELKNLPLRKPTKELISEQRAKHARQVEIAQKIEMLERELNELNEF